MGFRIAIPARYASERLPGKVLAPLAGRPLLAHVCDRARESGAREIWLTSDDERVLDAASALTGVRLFKSASEHRSGSDRVAELARAQAWPADNVVVNLQGDEPFMPGALVAQTGEALLDDPAADIATACCGIHDASEYANTNAVKVVRDDAGYALYFSRAAIPHERAGTGCVPAAGAWRHLGIYAYRVASLLRFADAAVHPLEQSESLEQLRALALGMRIRVVEAATLPGPGVDTSEDLEWARRLLERKS